MKIGHSVLVALLFGGAVCWAAPTKVTVVVTHELPAARPAEMVVVPWAEIAKHIPNASPEKLRVTVEGSTTPLPYQFTNFNPEDRDGAYHDVLFQHDFAAGEKRAVFTVSLLDKPAEPFPSRVSARYIPERYDDFAWENDRVAHRIYGPALETPVAGKSQMVGSGIDVWAKRVRYPIVDRWYLRGHNNYHKDNGEGLDFYSVGTARGCGGTGVWDGHTLLVSHNWKTWKVLANGPLRAIFELGYDDWEIGGGRKIRETKRFIVDAGSNLDRIESTFTLTGPPDVLIGIGLGKHAPAVSIPALNQKEGWMSRWEQYPKEVEKSLGCGVVLAPHTLQGFAEDDTDQIALVKASSGVPVVYYAGAGWTRSGDFSTETDWETYLAAFARRLASPLTVTVAEAP